MFSPSPYSGAVNTAVKALSPSVTITGPALAVIITPNAAPVAAPTPVSPVYYPGALPTPARINPAYAGSLAAAPAPTGSPANGFTVTVYYAGTTPATALALPPGATYPGTPGVPAGITAAVNAALPGLAARRPNAAASAAATALGVTLAGSRRAYAAAKALSYGY